MRQMDTVIPCVQVSDVVSKQARIERQDKPTVEGVSFDRAAANSFQAYCQSALAFSIKRGGILYGTGVFCRAYVWRGCSCRRKVAQWQSGSVYVRT